MDCDLSELFGRPNGLTVPDDVRDFESSECQSRDKYREVKGKGIQINIEEKRGQNKADVNSGSVGHCPFMVRDDKT